MGFVSSSTLATAFAKDCKRIDLNKNSKRLDALDQLTLQEKNDLLEMNKSGKLTEILSCTTMKWVYLSRVEVDFAKDALKKEQLEEIRKIQDEEAKLNSLLNDPDLDEGETACIQNH